MMAEPSRIVVLGGYGLIGAAVVRTLRAQGHAVAVFGRDARAAARVLPGVDFVPGDLRDMRTAGDWGRVLEGADFVVNAAGALQDMPGDDLQAVHVTAIGALAQACATRDVGLVQISAAGVAPGATTAFFRTKAAGDAAVRAAGGVFWILRPGLVLAPTSYGGTQLLRMLAAVPWVQPVVFADAPMQVIAVADVARAVGRAVAGQIAPGQVLDLVSDDAPTLAALIAAYRRWLGFARARAVWRLSGALAVLVGWGADGLARLGWRSPLRSTVLRVTRDGVRGVAHQTHAALGRPAQGLADILAAHPARTEDRLHARMMLLMPIMLALLAGFWVVSGLIGLVRLPQAADLLVAAGWGGGAARAAVLAWSAVDITLGLAVLVRPWAGRALWGMVAVSGVYLVAASVVSPDLWADPLGPLVKILPAMGLAMVTRAMLAAR